MTTHFLFTFVSLDYVILIYGLAQSNNLCFTFIKHHFTSKTYVTKLGIYSI
jgi:hypothetical protein